MKKLFLLISLFIFAVGVMAQSTSPRYGTTANADNTGRVLTFKLVSVTDVAGADTLIVKANAFQTTYKITLVDSLRLSQPVVTSCSFGDNIIIYATCASGTPKLQFSGDKWLSAGTATLSTNKAAIIEFFFNGAKWVEKGRYVQ